MSLSKKSLLMTSRLCTFGAIVFGVGFSFVGLLSFRLAVCPFIFFALDGCVTTWLRNVHEDERVNEITNAVCIVGQVCMLVSTLLCLPFYNSVPLVRAGCLMVTPTVLAVGFSQAARDTFCHLFMNFVVVAYCESEPMFLVCLLLQSGWLVFAAWKGSELTRCVEREASLKSLYLYDRMVQKLLSVLLDFTLRVEAVCTGDAAPSAESGEPLAEEASAPDIAAWRMQEDNTKADHFFGKATCSTDVIDLICSAADKERAALALFEASRSAEAVPQLLSNVHMWCSALAVASPATTGIASAPNAAHVEEMIEGVVDLIVVGPGPLSHSGLERACVACIGVRVVGGASGNRLDDATPGSLIRAPRITQVVPESGRVGVPGSHILLSELERRSSLSSLEEQVSTTATFPHVHSVSMAIDAFSNGLHIERMTCHFSKASRPSLLDWVHKDNVEPLEMWIQGQLNGLAHHNATTNYGHICLSSGHRSFLVAEGLVMEEVWREGGGEDDDEQDEGHCDLANDVCAEAEPTVACRVCFQGVSQFIWPPWLAAGVPHRYPAPTA